MARRRHPRNTSAPITLPLSLSSSLSLLFSFSFCCSPFVRSFAQLVIVNVRFLLFLSICRSFPVALNLTSHRWQSGFVYPPLGDVPDNGARQSRRDLTISSGTLSPETPLISHLKKSRELAPFMDSPLVIVQLGRVRDCYIYFLYLPLLS